MMMMMMIMMMMREGDKKSKVNRLSTLHLLVETFMLQLL